MCIAILNSKGILSKKTLKTCWDNNSDGAGFAYAEKGKIKVIKEMDNFNTFYGRYLECRKGREDQNFIIHFRITTHGKVDLTNCHPFKVNNELAFIHNGIINNVARHLDYSDTYIFNEVILKKLPKDFIFNSAIIELIDEYIGWSKLVFLTGKGEAVIVGEKSGKWDGGNWFSNDSYKESKFVYVGLQKVAKNDYKSGSKANVSTKEIKPNLPVYNAQDWTYEKGVWVNKKDVKKYQPDNPAGNSQTSTFWGEDLKECGCCNEPAKLTYVPEWHMDLCKKCIDDYCL